MTNKILLVALLALIMSNASGQTVNNKKAGPEARINNILSKLTLEEKIKMCSGVVSEEAFSGIKRLNIPDVKCSDGPRGPNRAGAATAFPSGISFGASWNPALVEEAGKIIGKETRAKGIGVLLGPGINIQRDPLNGRFFEYYTEDPFLNSAITVADVKGIQAEGVAACLKHYACNNREDNRNFYMSMVDERTMNEIYLPAFKAAVQKANVMTIMTSANGVNNEFVSDSKKLLTDILENEWGFKGFTLTDWLQTRSTEKAALAGLDISMPGGDDCGFGKPLLEAVKQGRVPMSVIDDKVRRILRVYEELGYLDPQKPADKSQINTPENQAVAREIAEQGMVLLKNNSNVLPLQASKIHKVLVVGPNADKLLCYPGAGGSSGIRGPYEITPLKGITSFLGADKVKYMTTEDLGGFHIIPQNAILNADGSKGFKAEYFVNGNDKPVLARVDSTIDFMWEMRSPDPMIKPDSFKKGVYHAKLIPPMDGKYTLKLIVGGIANMYHGDLNGEHLAFNDSRQTLNTTYSSVVLKKDIPYEISIEYDKLPGDAAIRLEWELPEAPAEKLAALDQQASEADAIIYVGGIDNSMDTEGRDRTDINFPGAQENMLNRLSKLNKNLVAVLVNGSPLQLGGWLPNVPAVLEAWYPGMEGGNAIANILFGNVNPSGKLPFTWPKALADVPCKKLATENNDFVYYTDSLMVGYRYYDTKNVQPEFPFGYGLSYTKFSYGSIKEGGRGKRRSFTIPLTNTGKLDGAEVVEVYVKPLTPHVSRPVHELKAFVKVQLKSGGTQNVAFSLGRDAFSYYDVRSKAWKVDPGKYEIQVGASSRDIRSVKAIQIN